ncbi:1,6-anhydro-N-acetylmuramyl-L-alanine amidase AmpD [Marinobacteraceae bacterium S3BR75-40.1]
MDDSALTPDGWLACARRVPSPNFDTRPAGEVISLLVIHNISLPPGRYGNDCVERFFCNQLPADEHPYFAGIADMRVSSHFMIRRDGELVQFVSLLDRAWHAGRSEFEGRAECNDYSIGVEMEGQDDENYSAEQYETLVRLTRTLMTLVPNITPERIVGHEHIAPGRKTDPGPAFDWQYYLSHLTLMKQSSDGDSA